MKKNKYKYSPEYALTHFLDYQLSFYKNYKERIKRTGAIYYHLLKRIDKEHHGKLKEYFALKVMQMRDEHEDDIEELMEFLISRIDEYEK